jgi:hypothetical protein
MPERNNIEKVRKPAPEYEGCKKSREPFHLNVGTPGDEDPNRKRDRGIRSEDEYIGRCM